MRRFLTILAVSTAGLASATAARASIIYQYVTDQTAYTVAPGATVTATVYLQETVTDPDTSVLVSENGLYGAAWAVAQTGAAPAHPSFANGTSAAADFNSSFNLTNLDNLAEFVDFSASNGALASDEISPGVRRVTLGTVTMQAPLDALDGETTSFNVGPLTPPTDLNPWPGNTVTWNNSYDLDATDNAGFPGFDSNPAPAYAGATPSPLFNVTVQSIATPEPASLGTTGVVVALLALRRRRRQA